MKIDIRDNLELRTLEPSDAGTFFELIRKNDAHLREWLYGHFVDLEVYSLLANEWNK